MKWYPVPNYTFPDSTHLPAEQRPAHVVDAFGGMIVECDSLEIAEHIASLHNQSLQAKEAA